MRIDLPISRSPAGVWEQRCSYSHADLHDEVLVDLDGPFGSVASAETEVVRFTVLGDRNAGKSTLLHALVHSKDANWLRLTSLLPVFAGAFVNARFGTPGPCVPGAAPRDELPFLDTDVASSVALLSREDFAFFANEFGVSPPRPLAAQTLFVGIHLVELGGDHLKSCMSEASSARPELLAATVEQSLATLAKSDALAYLVNASSLVDGGTVCAAQWRGLIRRLEWLSETAAPRPEITLYVSRLPESFDVGRSLDALEPIYGTLDRAALLEASARVDGDYALPASNDGVDDAETQAVRAAYEADAKGTTLTRFLAALLRIHHGCVRVGAVRCARHVRDGHAQDSAVDVPGLVSLLVSLFERRLASQASPPGGLVAARVFESALKAVTTVVDGAFEPWVDRRTFCADVDADPCGAGLPAHVLVDAFEDVASALVARGLLVERGDADWLCVDGLGETKWFRARDDAAPRIDAPPRCVFLERSARPADGPGVEARAPLTGAQRRLAQQCAAHSLVTSQSDALPAALWRHVEPARTSAEAAAKRCLHQLGLDADAPLRAIWLADDLDALVRLAEIAPQAPRNEDAENEDVAARGEAAAPRTWRLAVSAGEACELRAALAFTS
ncbi:hypothetical protein M885DRAFT_623343 [Pelagophyceae sp. CCMP2097]|nr:hypothetical protein M885DRAFT_623343 [Pelagophyceae sp. CCMP2097]